MTDPTPTPTPAVHPPNVPRIFTPGTPLDGEAQVPAETHPAGIDFVAHEVAQSQQAPAPEAPPAAEPAPAQ